jgi:trans-aconitate 2-methyltransferase
MTPNDWNPELYLKFNKERIQPSVDLVSRIDITNPSRIIDIGCGPGNSTQILSRRWPECKITGVDNSKAMIEKAKKDFPDQEWQLLDAGKDEIPGKFDIIFSNATIQWIPNHFELLKKFKDMLSSSGVVAVQIPLFFDMSIGKSLAEISGEKRWPATTRHANDLFTIYHHTDYYDFLSALFHTIEIWETDYMHAMDSHEAILEMIRSTGLRPYLDTLESATDKKDFEEKVLAGIRKDYPLQKDGKVLFPFKRLFFIAKSD